MVYDPSISYTVVPTGGAVVLSMCSQAQTAWALSRSVSGASGLGASTVLWEGAPSLPQVGIRIPPQPYVDVGDGTTLPLNPSLLYVYTLTTPNGTAQTPPISPAASVVVVPDPLTDMLLKLIEGGIESLRIPAGFQNKPKVLQAMPLTGQFPFPSIFLNQDLMQMTETQIGGLVGTDLSRNQYTLSDIVQRRISVVVATTNPQERAFYRDAIIAIYKIIAGTVLGSIGQDLTIKYQAADTQSTEPDVQPGFYMSQIMLDFSGTFNVSVQTSYDYVAAIVPGTISVP